VNTISSIVSPRADETLAVPMQYGVAEETLDDRDCHRGSRGAVTSSRRALEATGAGAGPRRSTETLKRDAYSECYQSIVAIWSDEGGEALDEIALMATINSILSHRFSTYFWTGFYRVCGDRLVVGPYIGTVGCLQIEFGRGVCGTAAAQRKTIIVPDVEKFPGHIACDANSKSEIVVPVFDRNGALIAVLDVDSDQLNAFDEEDREGLERIVALFAQ
jgi:L-methionine (R)-S-oxide reductase